MKEKELARELLATLYVFRQEHNASSHGRKDLKEEHGHKKAKGAFRDVMFLHGIKNANQGEKVKMSDLSEYFHITPAAVSQIIRDLENNGLVERVMLASDRRSVYIHLTSKAEPFIKEHEDIVNGRIIHMVKELGEHDAKELIRIMKRCLSINEEYQRHCKKEL